MQFTQAEIVQQVIDLIWACRAVDSMTEIDPQYTDPYDGPRETNDKLIARVRSDEFMAALNELDGEISGIKQMLGEEDI